MADIIVKILIAVFIAVALVWSWWFENGPHKDN